MFRGEPRSERLGSRLGNPPGRDGAVAEAASAAAVEAARRELELKVAELTTVNELSVALASTFDLETLVGRSLEIAVGRLRFDRALILLLDKAGTALSGGRSVGTSPEGAARIAAIDLPLDGPDSPLTDTFRADGPLLFEELDRDPDPETRGLASALGTTSVLATPLVSNGRSVGVLVVDQPAGGRVMGAGDGPLLFTVGSLIAGAVESSRLYREIQAYSHELEERVAARTRDLASAVEEAQAERASAEEARATAEAANASKTAFLNSVSHELRTPLTSVVGFSRIIAKRLDEVVYPVIVTDDPKVQRAMRQARDNLGIIVEEGERLTTMINDILDLAKIEAGRMEFRRVAVDVGELLARGLAATSSLFSNAGLELVTDVEPGLPTIEGDRDRLLQVVINLVSNAVKFTPRGGTITCRARLGVGAGAGGGPGGTAEVVVSVSDTGVGIAPADHAKVFEQFGQAGDTLTDKPRGTGLGLPICREIVGHHGGRLWLESAVDAGSTFSFALPLVPPAA